jgi:ABC-type amino acid transport substrate-binding protein
MRHVCLIAASLIAVAPSARAATIAVPENLGPWGLSANLPTDQRGIYANLAEALQASSSVPLDIKFVPYGRMLQGIKSGDVDYAFGLVTPATLDAAPFTTIVAQVPMLAVARKGMPLKALDDLHGFKDVGYLRGGSCGPLVDGDAAVHRVPQDSYETAIRKLAAGRLDGWCSIKAGFTYTLSSLKLDSDLGDQVEYGAIKIGLQVSKANLGTPDEQSLSATMKKIVASGTAGQIFTHYLGAPYQP